MRLLAAAATSFLLLASASSAGGGSSGEKTIGLRADLEEMSADGGRVALLTEDFDAGCRYLAVWDPLSAKVVHFPARCEPASYDLVRLAGGRVGWLDLGHSSRRYCEPFTALLSSPKRAHQLTQLCGIQKRVISDVAIGYGFDGDGPLMAVGVWVECNGGPCGGGTIDDGIYAADVYRFAGTKLTKVLSRRDDRELLDVNRNRILTRDGGSLVVWSKSGRAIARVKLPANFRDEGFVAKLGGSNLVVQVDKTLTVYNAATGKRKTTFAVEIYDIEDVEGAYAVYDDHEHIVFVRLSDGRRTVVRTVEELEAVQLEPQGLFYSWRDQQGKGKEWRVTFVQASKLPG
jgi:hypothetical protein